MNDLTTCRACGKHVAQNARTCPHCGASSPDNAGTLGGCVGCLGGCIAGAIVAAIMLPIAGEGPAYVVGGLAVVGVGLWLVSIATKSMRGVE